MRTMLVACLIAAVYAVHESGQTLSSSCQTKLLRAVIDDNYAKGAGNFFPCLPDQGAHACLGSDPNVQKR